MKLLKNIFVSGTLYDFAVAVQAHDQLDLNQPEKACYMSHLLTVWHTIFGLIGGNCFYAETL